MVWCDNLHFFAITVRLRRMRIIRSLRFASPALLNFMLKEHEFETQECDICWQSHPCDVVQKIVVMLND